MEFLSSLPGQYLVQTVLHSAIIAAAVEAILYLWRVRSPYLQIRFRILVLALPPVAVPVFFAVYPPRVAASFRQVALFDHSQWLGLGLGAGIYAWHIFLATLAVTTVYFIAREAVPAWRLHREEHGLLAGAEGRYPRLTGVLASLAGTGATPLPEVLISPEETPVIHTRGRRTLVLSAATLELLDAEELEAVIAHELAHLSRRVYRMTQIAAVLRFVSFYNPVALLVFHRIINDAERHCDDTAVRLTGKRLAMASGLLKVFRQTSGASGSHRLRHRVSTLERRAHATLIRERMEWLARPAAPGDTSFPDLRLWLVAGLLVALLFFVV